MNRIFEFFADAVMWLANLSNELSVGRYDDEFTVEHKRRKRYCVLSVVFFPVAFLLALGVGAVLNALGSLPGAVEPIAAIREPAAKGVLVVFGVLALNLGWAVWRLISFEREHGGL